MKKIYVMLIGALVASLGFYACSQPEVEDVLVQNENLDNPVFTSEATSLKENFIVSMQKIKDIEEKSLSRSSSNTDRQMNDLLKKLSKQTVEMFKSYGLKDSWEEFDGLDDPRIALVGIMFLGVLESNNKAEMNSMLLSRSYESGSGECFDMYKVANCILKSLIGVDWGEITAILSSYTCITKTIAKNILKKLAVRIGIVGVAVALYDFGDCMGWY